MDAHAETLLSGDRVVAIGRNITQATKVANGYFIEKQLSADEELVTTGTQMLLSHEFRSQIPDEDDDD